MAASNKQHRSPPPPPAFPIFSSRSAQLENASFANHNNTSQFTDASIPAPPCGHSRTISDTSSSLYSNPFGTPRHTPHASDASAQPIFSPISPIEEEEDYPPSLTTALRSSSASQPTKMSEPRKSVDLRQLDGKPYPSREEESEPKPRKVKVAQDMFPGEMPPGYDRQDYNGPLASKGAHSGACHKCGGHKKDSSITAPIATEKTSPPVQPTQPAQQTQNGDCAKCGGKSRSTPPSSYPTAAMAHVQPRSQPLPRPHPTIDSVAGPSSVPNATRHKCTKCGRQKRPDSISSIGSPIQPQSPQNFGAAYQHRIVPSIQTNGIPIDANSSLFDINIEPPTATTERAPTIPFSPASVSDRPLIQRGVQPELAKERKVSRGNSISSLFRSLSRRSSRRSSQDKQLPSQKLANSGEQNPDQIIDKISNAIRDGDDSYSRLRPQDYVQRPISPFSFVSKTQEDQAFEMNDMRKSKLSGGIRTPTPERRNSWDKADESTLFLDPERPKFNRSQTTSSKLRTMSVGGIDDLYLGVSPDQRPGVTRFKSLRSGVNRASSVLSRSASQISRSTSLRRLESVKKVPQFWYRNDMTIEGANGSEYVVNVY